MAERAGFEPAEPFGSRALQARALGQTTQPLRAYYGADYTILRQGWQGKEGREGRRMWSGYLAWQWYNARAEKECIYERDSNPGPHSCLE